jgi:hypothetical protein
VASNRRQYNAYAFEITDQHHTSLLTLDNIWA